MSFNSSQLDAFLAVVQTQSFSKAAKQLLIGQPALSQRIALLEESLHVTLLERGTGFVRPTEAGHILLRYCQQRNALEEEVLSQFTSRTHELTGFMRIAAPSTLMAPVVLPALSQLVRENPKLRIEFHVRQLHEIPLLLFRGQVDFAVLDRKLDRQGVESEILGHESYASFESTQHSTLRETYFDTFEDDRLTERYFEFHKKRRQAVPKSFVREFTGDVNVMIDAVVQGLGRAVLPIHFVPKDGSLRRIDRYDTLYTEPVYINYFKQTFPPKLMTAVVSTLKTNAQKSLRAEE